MFSTRPFLGGGFGQSLRKGLHQVSEGKRYELYPTLLHEFPVTYVHCKRQCSLKERERERERKG